MLTILHTRQQGFVFLVATVRRGFVRYFSACDALTVIVTLAQEHGEVSRDCLRDERQMI